MRTTIIIRAAALAATTLTLAACGPTSGDGGNNGLNAAGFTSCGDDQCQPGLYCADDTLGICELGCLSNVNCDDAQTCEKASGQDVGSCQATSNGSGNTSGSGNSSGSGNTSGSGNSNGGGGSGGSGGGGNAVCGDGVCQASESPAFCPMDCGPQDECAVDGDCDPGEVCDFNVNGQVFVCKADPFANYGKTCTSNQQCEGFGLPACLFHDELDDYGYCTAECESFTDCPTFWDCDNLANAAGTYCIQD